MLNDFSTHTSVILVIVLASLSLILLFWAGRMLYQRSVRLRNHLQMERIFTNIGHELLTPLTVISASVSRLRELEPRFKSDYALMELNIDRMVRLLQEILETSKSQAGELKLLVSQGDVMKFISQTALCMQPLMTRNKVGFAIDCEPKSMMGWIDTDKLDKIIYNLLSNAAKYSAENGEVSIKVITNYTYDHIRIIVSDTGEGIPPEKLKHLFDRFYVGHYDQQRTIGTGVGLALTRDLVYLHKGTIDCQSELGKGTVFTVTLPIYKEAFKPEQINEQHKIDFNIPKNAIIDFKTIVPDINADSDDEENDDDNYKVLVVEDNPELLMLMQQLLKSYYRVYIAHNGAEALKIVHDKEIDLIVSDVMMPEMDGYELTRTIKGDANYNHLPIILLTAKTQEEDEEEGLEAGADEFLTKPFRLKDLKLRIDNIIENRKRMQTEFSQESAEETRQKVAKPLTPDEIFLNRVLEFVHQHLADEDYDRDALAADMGASASTLYNKLRSITGMNVSAFIRDYRMKEARRMAEENPNLRVSDLAYSVGFHDPRYFSTCFKKQFGIQPKEFLDSLNK